MNNRNHPSTPRNYLDMFREYSVKLEFPTPDHYNVVRHFDVQDHHVPAHILLGIGEILIKHGMHRHLRPFLLHRHEVLRTGMIMVHAYPDANTETCHMLPFEDYAGTQLISPSSFRLNDANEFEVFEFIEGSLPLTIREECWKELGVFITVNQLRETIGFARAAESMSCWYESLRPDGLGTVARRLDGKMEEEWALTGIVTEWALFETNNVVRFSSDEEV